MIRCGQRPVGARMQRRPVPRGEAREETGGLARASRAGGRAPPRTTLRIASRAMSTSTRTETVTAADGGTFAGHLALPEAGSGPGIVLIQEIFGVNGYLRSVADRLAAMGYVVLAPELYWRIEPGIALGHTDEELGIAFGLVQQLDLDLAVADTIATLAHLRDLSEVTAGAGLLGFCLGGSVGYLTAAATDADCLVSYYGSIVSERLDVLDGITGPALFHFGGNDPFIPREQVALVEQAADGRDHVEVLVQEAGGHAFDNDDAPAFYNAEAAGAAWDRTTTFLAEHLPVG